jgi:hypothetical protein
MNRKAKWVLAIASGLALCGLLTRTWLDRRDKARALQLAEEGSAIASALYGWLLEPNSAPIDISYVPLYPWTNEFRTSTEYFNHAVTNRLLREVESHPTLSTRVRTLLSARENAWCVVLGHPGDVRVPLLFSRNAMFAEPKSKATLNDISGISRDALPQIRRLVVIFLDGEWRILGDKEDVWWMATARVPHPTATRMTATNDLRARFNPSGRPMKFLSPEVGAAR